MIDVFIAMNIYIHIPFCVKKCSYCNLYSLPGESPSGVDRFLVYLEREFALKIKKFNLLSFDQVKNIFIGGGTPSYLSIKQLEKLFSILEKYIALDGIDDLAIEMNPASTDLDKLQFLKKRGITKISFGIQTSDKKILKSLNRHFVADPSKIIIKAKGYGFDVNLDFMIGLPNQTLSDIKKSLSFVKNILPTSIHLFPLRIGEKQRKQQLYFAHSSEKVREKMYSLLREKLIDLGYKQLMYQFFSLKNKINYGVAVSDTLNKTTIGFGPFAVSRINNSFIKNVNDLSLYYYFLDRGKMPILGIYKLNKQEEAILQFFKIEKGSISLKELGIKGYVYLNNEINACLESEYLLKNGDKLILTEEGKYFFPKILSGMISRKCSHLLNIIGKLFEA